MTISFIVGTGDLSAKLQELSTELEDIKMRRMAQETDISLIEDPATKVMCSCMTLHGDDILS